ncbi:LOW QUALITY PROTEIN: hypothetical protein TorRG33x02_032140 [Trema orientale]|uniref:Uncharacterized protein n=1 Tax=Trema orientale TaxID=63057 RepID=A0A2P5FTB8_TREOI|nr:LOW QUALITY PROTEIN: hypothetical protein TorRG33x02_032140 [Trema orientale]
MRTPPPTNSSSTRFSSRVVVSLAEVPIDSTPSCSVEIEASSQKGPTRTDELSEPEYVLAVIGSGARTSAWLESLMSLFFFFFFLEDFFNRSRFLTKRSMREVGKPVSTTRELPRFGDWRSATIRDIRVTLAFLHGRGMVVPGFCDNIYIFFLKKGKKIGEENEKLGIGFFPDGSEFSRWEFTFVFIYRGCLSCEKKRRKIGREREKVIGN